MRCIHYFFARIHCFFDGTHRRLRKANAAGCAACHTHFH